MKHKNNQIYIMYCLGICAYVVNYFLKRKGLLNTTLRMAVVAGEEGRETG